MSAAQTPPGHAPADLGVSRSHSAPSRAAARRCEDGRSARDPHSPIGARPPSRAGRFIRAAQGGRRDIVVGPREARICGESPDAAPDRRCPGPPGPVRVATTGCLRRPGRRVVLPRRSGTRRCPSCQDRPGKVRLRAVPGGLRLPGLRAECQGTLRHLGRTDRSRTRGGAQSQVARAITPAGPPREGLAVPRRHMTATQTRPETDRMTATTSRADSPEPEITDNDTDHPQRPGVPATRAGRCECCSAPYPAGALVVWDSVGLVLIAHRSASSRR